MRAQSIKRLFFLHKMLASRQVIKGDLKGSTETPDLRNKYCVKPAASQLFYFL